MLENTCPPAYLPFFMQLMDKIIGSLTSTDRHVQTQIISASCSYSSRRYHKKIIKIDIQIDCEKS